jgi:hypothetical protein
MKLKLSFNLVKKLASESKNSLFYGILNIALYTNSLKSPNSSTSGTFLRPSTPPHVILKLVKTACSRHVCTIVLSAPRHENFEIWSTPLVTQALYHCSERPGLEGWRMQPSFVI